MTKNMPKTIAENELSAITGGHRDCDRDDYYERYCHGKGKHKGWDYDDYCYPRFVRF